MIIGLATSFPADTVERQLPDVASAQRLLGTQRPDFGELLDARRDRLLTHFGNALAAPMACTGAPCSESAVSGWPWQLGSDYHHYHNENMRSSVDGRWDA